LSQKNGIDNQGKCESIQAEVIVDENIRENELLLKAFKTFLLVIWHRDFKVKFILGL